MKDWKSVIISHGSGPGWDKGKTKVSITRNNKEHRYCPGEFSRARLERLVGGIHIFMCEPEPKKGMEIEHMEIFMGSHFFGVGIRV
jgi:hypothetical protein